MRFIVMFVTVVCVLFLKNGSHMQKWVTLGKLGHPRKNGPHVESKSHLEKWIKLRKMDHTSKNGSHLKYGSHLEKCITLGKMGYI